MINVGSIDYYSFNSTNGIAIDIFLTGCTQYCKGCHNTHLWDKDAGIRMSIDEIAKIVSSKKRADSIAIMGGEPLENVKLLELLRTLRITCAEKEIWLYTSFSLEEIPEEIKQYCDYIKTGRFEEDLYCDKRLKSLNQRIYKNNQGIFELYYSPVNEGGIIVEKSYCT